MASTEGFDLAGEITCNLASKLRGSPGQCLVWDFRFLSRAFTPHLSLSLSLLSEKLTQDVKPGKDKTTPEHTWPTACEEVF